MEILERYLYDIRRALPKSDRDEIINELKSSILDEFELTEQTEKNMESIILKMGSPVTVASEYHSNPLLSKEAEMFYFFLIKIVSMAVAVGLLLAKLTQLVFNSEALTVASVISTVALSLPSLFTSVLTSVGIITIIIFVVDKKVGLKPRKFKITDLTVLSKTEKEISRVAESFKIIFTIPFIVFINSSINTSIDGINLFADISNAIMILTVFLIIDVAIFSSNLIKGSVSKIMTRVIQIKDIAGGLFLGYLSTIDIFNPNWIEIPNFPRIIIKVVFIGLAIVTIYNALKPKEK